MATIERRGAPRVIAFTVLAGLAQGCAAAMAPVSAAAQLLEQDRSARQRREMDRRVAEAQAERKRQREERLNREPSPDDLAPVAMPEPLAAPVINPGPTAAEIEQARQELESGGDLVGRICAAIEDGLAAEEIIRHDDRVREISGTTNVRERHAAGERIEAAAQEMRAVMLEWGERFADRRIQDSGWECQTEGANEIFRLLKTPR